MRLAAPYTAFCGCVWCSSRAPARRFEAVSAVGLASHVVMRLWSAVDFIPKALRFERDDGAEVSAVGARQWARRSLLRLPLDMVTCDAMFAALVTMGAMF